MPNLIDKIFWAVLGVVLPGGVFIVFPVLMSLFPHIEEYLILVLCGFLFVCLPVVYIVLAFLKKKCSLFFAFIGYILSTVIAMHTIQTDPHSFFPNLGKSLYLLYVTPFIVATVTLTIIDLVLQKRKRNKQLKQSHCYDTMEHTANKGIHFTRKVYNYIKKIFTDD